MTAAAPLLDDLKRQRPEWTPWLGVVEVALRESEGTAWNEAVPATAASGGAAPRLADARLHVPARLLRAYVQRLLAAAASSGTGEMATLAAAQGRMDTLVLFRAALCQQPDVVEEAAGSCGAHPEALHAVAALVPVPFLQACARAWGARPGWVEPYCPVCGAWPAFVEIRGIERSRHYRCGRCGSDWHAHALSCTFCGTGNHRDLVRLVPGDPLSSSAVEACMQCRGYVKTFNRLQRCTPGAVLLEDLRGVALDLAAIEQGYARPTTAAYQLAPAVATS